MVKLIYLCSIVLIMADKNIITIDLNKWETQQDAANKRLGKHGRPVSIQYISKLVKNNKINSFAIPQLNIVLVEKTN